jgi:hypothetical protein
MQMLRLPLKFWKPLGIGFFIIVLCLIPSDELAKIDPKIGYEDLAMHLLMFVGLSVFLYRDLRNYAGHAVDAGRIAVMTVGIGTLLGIATELLQFLLTGLNRSGSFVDLFFDMAGSIAGVAIIRLIKP